MKARTPTRGLWYGRSVSARGWLLLSWVLIGTSVLVVHAIVLWQVVRSEKLAKRWRALALFPPAAPVIAWRAGLRGTPIAWGVLVVTYLVLRLFG